MNNHYVPQFIIKEFNSKPYFYDMQKRLLLKRQPKKVFYEENMYSDEIETIANQKVEFPFSILLKEKLNNDKVILTREEMELVKRYMLLASIRTMGEDGFAEKMYSFASNAERYLTKLRRTPEGFYLGFKKKVSDLGLTNRDLYMMAMERFCNDRTSQDLLLDLSLPLEMYVWAIAFTASYISIWDAPEDKQFILTDCGMNTEYEGARQLTGYDLSKFAYLTWLVEHGSQSESEAAKWYLACSDAMFENFNFFPISNHRVIVAIHPFFRMYFPDKLIDKEGKRIFESKPNIWPTCLENPDLFSVPACSYDTPGQFTPNDVFTYESKRLSPFETDYLNFLMAGCAKNAIAFDNPESIKLSVMTAFWGYARMQSVTNIGSTIGDKIKNPTKNLSDSKFRPLVEALCNSQLSDIEMSIAVATFTKIYNLWILDFEENPYIAKYLVDHPQALCDERAFGFLGSFEKSKELLVERAKVLKPKQA